MTAMVFTNAEDGYGAGDFAPGGSAATLLDGISAASDSKSVVFDQLTDHPKYLKLTLDDLGGLPAAVDITLRSKKTAGDPIVIDLILKDSSGQPWFGLADDYLLLAAYEDKVLSLSQVYFFGSPSAGSWILELWIDDLNNLTSSGFICDAEIDAMSGDYSGSGGGSGPGGQSGVNAAIMIPCGMGL